VKRTARAARANGPSKKEHLRPYDTKSSPSGQSANADNGFAEAVTFLTTLFGDPEKAYAVAFRDLSAANWTGGHGIARLSDLIQQGADAYFTIGRIADTETRRSPAGVDLHVAVGVDDVGGKVDAQLWADLFAQGCPEPMAVVETSPSNSQFFWRLDPPIPSTDTAGVADLQHFRDLLADAGLTDAATIDVAHYFRLGAGHNSKEKHKVANGGVAPPVR
jgi:hypothetical protein